MQFLLMCIHIFLFGLWCLLLLFIYESIYSSLYLSICFWNSCKGVVITEEIPFLVPSLHPCIHQCSCCVLSSLPLCCIFPLTPLQCAKTFHEHFHCSHHKTGSTATYTCYLDLLAFIHWLSSMIQIWSEFLFICVYCLLFHDIARIIQLLSCSRLFYLCLKASLGAQLNQDASTYLLHYLSFQCDYALLCDCFGK